MQSNGSNPKADIIFSVSVIVFSVIVYVGAMGLPPAYWEPLGSAALPKALSVIMTLLCLYILVRALLALRTYVPPKPKEREFTPRPGSAFAMLVMLAAYIGVMNFGILGFVEATTIFLVALCMLFTHGDRKQLPWIIGFALVIAIVNFLIFTKVLYIDLPVTEWLWGEV